MQVEQRTRTTLRANDNDALRQCLRTLKRETGVSLVVGGSVVDQRLKLTDLIGARHTGLQNLEIPLSLGLGGRVAADRRPKVTDTYESDSTFTHDFDEPVLAEGILSVAAAPLVVDSHTRGVIYLASRDSAVGDRAVDLLMRGTQRLAREISIRDEVDRRILMLESLATDSRQDSVNLEDLRLIHADLRALASSADEGTRAGLDLVCHRLAEIGSHKVAGSNTGLSRRELDVLSQAALGCNNARIAERLSVSQETVKAHMRNLMVKLDCHTRVEAVFEARRRGLLI